MKFSKYNQEENMNGPTTYKAIAEVLPWQVQSALLAIRDDGLKMKDLPTLVYVALFELQLIEVDDETENVSLSRLGCHLVDFCTC